MFLAVGMLFTIAFWHEASREPVWIGAASAGLGEAGKSAYSLRLACCSTLFLLGNHSTLVPVGHTQEATR